MINFVKRIHNKLLTLQQQDSDILLWDIAQDGLLFQKFPSVAANGTVLAWSKVSNHFVAVSSHLVRLFSMEQDCLSGWKEVASLSLHFAGEINIVNFAFPILYAKCQKESYIVNVLSEEKRIVPEVNCISELASHFEKLSQSGRFLIVEDSSIVSTPNSIDSGSEGASNICIFSMMPLISGAQSDITDFSDLKKTEILFQKVTHAQPTSWSWLDRIAGTNYELLSVVFADFTVAVYSISHECTMEDDGIMAIALKAVMAARSINSDSEGGLFRLEEEPSEKSSTSLVPSIILVAVLDTMSCKQLLNIPSEVQQVQSAENNQNWHLRTSWLDTIADPATMIEEDDDNNPIVSSSSKMALPPVVRKSKRVDLAHQGYWIALLCGHRSELRTVVIRVGYEVQLSSFQFDISSQVRARVMIAHNGSMPMQWSQKACHFEGYFSTNFRHLVAVQSISFDTLHQSTVNMASVVSLNVLQRLHMRNKAGEFRKVFESNFYFNSPSSCDAITDVGHIRHMVNSEREGKIYRLPSVAVLGLQKQNSLPKIYLLPISDTSCRHVGDGKEVIHHHSRSKRNKSRRRYVLDESDFVLCAFDDSTLAIEVYIRDPAYLSGSSQLSPRPKASTSSLEEIHRGRYGSNPNIYYVDIIPDEQYGLGLRLDEEKDYITGYIKVVINSFKPHPITNEPMAAELTCKISVGDEIIGANTVSFVNKSQSYVIQTMKSLLATNHGNILRLVMKRTEKISSPIQSNNAIAQLLGSGSDNIPQNLEVHSNQSNWLHSYLQLHGVHHPIRDFQALAPVQVLSLHPLKAHVELLIPSTPIAEKKENVVLQVVDVNTMVILDEVGQNEVTVFALVQRSTSEVSGFELHVFQLRYQPTLGHYVTLKAHDPHRLTTLRSKFQTGLSLSEGRTNSTHPCHSISMVTNLLHAPDSKNLSFSVTIYHPPSLSLPPSAPVLQTIIEGRVQRIEHDSSSLHSTMHLEIVNLVELCRFPIDRFLESFQIDQSVYSRGLEQYSRMQGQERNRQAQEEAEGNSLETLVANNTSEDSNSMVAMNEELLRRKKEWAFLDSPVSVDVFLSTLRFFTMAREVNQSIEESLVDIVSILLQLQGHNVLYNIEAVDHQWTERNSNDAGQILQILQKRNYIGRFQDYVRGKLKSYVDFRAKEFVAEYSKHRNEMFSMLAWQYKCDNSPWIYLGEQQATCSALFVIDHLAEVLKFASHVYVQGHSNPGFVKFLNSSEALTIKQQRDDWRLLSTLLVQGQGYLQLDGYGMNSILYAMTKRGYTSAFLHVARKLESHKPEIFLRGRKMKAMEALDDGEDDYKRTLTALAMNTNNSSDSNSSTSNNSFSVGGSTLYEEKKKQREFEAMRLAQSQFIPMYVSMTSVINAMFSSSQEALFIIFVDNFNVLGREDDVSRLEMLLALGKDVSYTPVSSNIPANAEPVPVWQSVDLLTYATRMKVSLWLHNLEPLVQLILRHALKQFKANKSAMEIFLDLVIIGKTETLMQLARTDPTPSGKQLLTLLLQVDEAFNANNSEEDESTRISYLITKLRKNADALVRKKRYREAAAVLLLLPTAQMIKSALSLLAFQFNAPFLAHLVARCIEYRIYCHGELSQQKLERNCLREMMQSNYDAVSSRLGFVAGVYSATLIERDMLPDLWRTMEFAKRSQQSTSFNQVQEQERRSSAYYHLEGIPCLQTIMVLALWTQKISLIRESFHKVMEYLEENLTFHPDSIGDFSRKIVLPSRSSETSSGAFGSSFTSSTSSGSSNASSNNIMGGIWTGKLGIPPMLMHEIHVGLTKSCLHDFSADDILIIQNFLRVTYGQDIYRAYGFIELFLSLGVFEAYAQIAGHEAMQRIARFISKLYSILGMEEEALRFQSHRYGCSTNTKKRSRSENAFVIFCERFRKTIPTNFNNVYEQLSNESSLVQQQAKQREQELLAVLAAQQRSQQSEVPSVPKMSFNFASKPTSSTSIQSSKPGSSRNLLDEFDAPSPSAPASPVKAPVVAKSAPRNLLDDFDAPPPVRKPKQTISTSSAAASSTSSAVDPFTNSSVPSALDNFDVRATSSSASARNKSNSVASTSTASPPSALDIFDMPVSRTATRRPPNAATATEISTSSILNPSAAGPDVAKKSVDPFDMSKVDQKSALDMFDMPPPRSSVSSRPKQQQQNQASDSTSTPSPSTPGETTGTNTTPAEKQIPAAIVKEFQSALDFDVPVSRPKGAIPPAGSSTERIVPPSEAPVVSAPQVPTAKQAAPTPTSTAVPVPAAATLSTVTHPANSVPKKAPPSNPFTNASSSADRKSVV